MTTRAARNAVPMVAPTEAPTMTLLSAGQEGAEGAAVGDNSETLVGEGDIDLDVVLDTGIIESIRGAVSRMGKWFACLMCFARLRSRSPPQKFRYCSSLNR